MKIDMMKAKLEAEGLSVRIWDGRELRLYIKQGDRELGYITEDDDGTTGTCKHVTRRQGYIAGILRR